MPFQTIATRSGIPVKVMIDGPAGSGKTYTALEIATGISQEMGRPIGVVDSQNGQSKRYADAPFSFYCEIIKDYSPTNYIKMINEAERAKLGVLILDSVTHEWAWCLELVDSIAKRTGSSNNGWRDITPQHKKFVEAIIQATIPIIVTVRTKTDWLYLEEQRGNRKIIVPHKVGTKPEQRDQFEFEFDLWLRMDRDNKALVEKSVFPFAENGTDIGRPSREIGQKIVRWFEGTSYSADDELDERDRHERASGGTSEPRSQQAAIPPRGKPAPQADEITDPETDLPDVFEDDDSHVGHDMEDDDADDDPEAEDERDSPERVALITRYRTLAAVAVIKRHAQGMKLAGAKLHEMTDAEIQGGIATLERAYPNVRQTGSYQCDTCGTKIYPHIIEEYQGNEFPGLQLIAISVRDFKKPLCARHLATERNKAKRRP